MLFRARDTIAVALAATLLATGAGQAQTGLKLGEKFEGELKGKEKDYVQFRVDGLNVFFEKKVWAQEHVVTLKAGQSISVSATVTGNDRKVALFLDDPKGARLAGNKTLSVKTAQLSAEEVNVTGRYKIIVASDRTGPFTLRATDPSNKGLDEKALKAKIADLEKELAELKKKLKELQEKKSK